MGSACFRSKKDSRKGEKIVPQVNSDFNSSLKEIPQATVSDYSSHPKTLHNLTSETRGEGVSSSKVVPSGKEIEERQNQEKLQLERQKRLEAIQRRGDS